MPTKNNLIFIVDSAAGEATAGGTAGRFRPELTQSQPSRGTPSIPSSISHDVATSRVHVLSEIRILAFPEDSQHRKAEVERLELRERVTKGSVPQGAC
jgi:hypothetical protein